MTFFEKLFVLSATLLMLLLSTFLYSSYTEVQRAFDNNSLRISNELHKKRLLTEMYVLVRERSSILFSMYDEKDFFIRDQLNSTFSGAGRNFIVLLAQLRPLLNNVEEKELLVNIIEEVRIRAPVLQEVSDTLMVENDELAKELLLTKVFPVQNLVVNGIKRIIDQYNDSSEAELKRLEIEKRNLNVRFKWFAVMLVLGSLFFIIFLSIYIFKRERKHFYAQVSQQKIHAEKLSYEASHDALTGLINRREFENRLQDLLKRSMDGESHAVLYLDLDQFKIINDTCGHHAGDELLRQIPELFKKHLRSADVLARLGGDEFAVITMHCDIQAVKRICKAMIDTLAEFQFTWDNKIFRVGVSIGVVELQGQESEVHEILRLADSACYAAKDEGRNQFKLYEKHDKLLKARSAEMDWLGKINKALETDGFILYAQPIVPTKTESNLAVNYEILLRMHDAEGISLPGAFLPAAERYNQIENIDRWVVQKSLEMVTSQKEFLNEIGYISINLSGVSISKKDSQKFLVDELADCDFLEKLVFEITETAVINNLFNVQQVIAILTGMGVRFSLDDFGSGLSSFAYLKNLNVDLLKIDGAFVRDIIDDPIDRAMVKSIHEVGSVMGKKTIAEYVETQQVFDMLGDIGVDYAQGNLLGRPQPLEEVLVNATINQ